MRYLDSTSKRESNTCRATTGLELTQGRHRDERTGVAGGRFNDDALAWNELAIFLGGEHHSLGNSVFDRTTSREKFNFGN